MAALQFTSDMPSGLRLEELFKPTVSGSLVVDAQGTLATARFDVLVYEKPLEVFYAGPTAAAGQGNISYLRFGPETQPWLVYGDLVGPVLFTYDNLAAFHAQGGLAAATIMAGSDVLTGSSRGDNLNGYAGSDTLDGRAGADTLDGGSGDDTYLVDNKEDRVFELVGGGYDTVWTYTHYALAAEAGVEELRAAAGTFSIALTGSSFNNLIVGTPGNDTLDGGSGVDTLAGGEGNDLYLVDYALDLIWEASGGGYDTVLTSTSYTLGENLEVLKATAGSSFLQLGGNALPNEIIGNVGPNAIDGFDGNDSLYGDGGNDSLDGGNGDDSLYGGVADDRLDGGAGSDALFGDVGNDALRGSTGDDWLYGGVGNDKLDGDEGSDRLYGDVGNDTIHGGSGSDWLYGGTGKNILYGGEGQDGLYGGMHADKLYGDADNDALYGDAGSDTLNGGAGNDTLSGGSGKDKFVFTTKLGTSRTDRKVNFDTIEDFSVKDDTFWIDNAIFKKLSNKGSEKKPVELDDRFFAFDRTQDKDDYIMYNRKTGVLSYDADGSGKGHAVEFAMLKKGLALTYKDFFVI